MNDAVAGRADAQTADDFFQRARARLRLDVPPALTDHSAEAVRGDLDLDPSVWERAGVVASRPAAVLVPVVDHPEPTVLLTQRTAELPSHAGQIAFPGGKIDEGDEGPLGAALREAEEEIGLPLVARVAPPYRLAINTGEVADAFEVPLSFLMTPDNHQRHSRDWKGIRREYYAMPFGERYIWGITAGILRNLWQRVYR